MKRDEFRFMERLRVRWSEVDLQKIVFNGHYLTYFDVAVAGYWRAMAMPYHATMERLGGDLYARKAMLEYEASARYEDVLDVGIRCIKIGNSSMVLNCAVFRGEQLLVPGELVYVFADPATQTSKPVPQDLREWITAFEAGKPMTEVRVGSWAELGTDAKAIRQEVFIKEQGIPADMEWDDADESCLHAVAYNRIGLPLATGRLLEHVPGMAKIGRMAVSQAMRGSGVGRSVLEALMQAARDRGEREAVLHAQLSATPFYQRQGFTVRGPTFDDVGIPHVEMVRTL